MGARCFGSAQVDAVASVFTFNNINRPDDRDSTCLRNGATDLLRCMLRYVASLLCELCLLRKLETLLRCSATGNKLVVL